MAQGGSGGNGGGGGMGGMLGGLFQLGDKLDPLHIGRKLGLAKGPSFLEPEATSFDTPQPVAAPSVDASKLAFLKAFGVQ